MPTPTPIAMPSASTHSNGTTVVVVVITGSALFVLTIALLIFFRCRHLCCLSKSKQDVKTSSTHDGDTKIVGGGWISPDEYLSIVSPLEQGARDLQAMYVPPVYTAPLSLHPSSELLVQVEDELLARKR